MQAIHDCFFVNLNLFVSHWAHQDVTGHLLLFLFFNCLRLLFARAIWKQSDSNNIGKAFNLTVDLICKTCIMNQISRWYLKGEEQLVDNISQINRSLFCLQTLSGRKLEYFESLHHDLCPYSKWNLWDSQCAHGFIICLCYSLLVEEVL